MCYSSILFLCKAAKDRGGDRLCVCVYVSVRVCQCGPGGVCKRRLLPLRDAGVLCMHCAKIKALSPPRGEGARAGQNGNPCVLRFEVQWPKLLFWLCARNARDLWRCQLETVKREARGSALKAQAQQPHSSLLRGIFNGPALGWG